jgi:hypothetical protein
MVQLFPSLHDIGTYWQTPPAQESLVHTLLSLHTIGVKTHPVAGLQLVIVQGSLAVQFMGMLEQTPLEQESLVHALLSLQSTGVEGTQDPFAGAHTIGKHRLVAAQVTTTGVLHLVQFGTVVFWHWPVPLHEPVIHPSPVLQSTALCAQPEAGLQVSIVQGLLSSQEIWVCPHPVEAPQVSLVQALWSLQLMGVNKQPVVVLQESCVHMLLSLQVTFVKTHPVVVEHESEQLG